MKKRIIIGTIVGVAVVFIGYGAAKAAEVFSTNILGPVKTGNTSVYRMDDTNKGVSCYVADGVGISCVSTGTAQTFGSANVSTQPVQEKSTVVPGVPDRLLPCGKYGYEMNSKGVSVLKCLDR